MVIGFETLEGGRGGRRRRRQLRLAEKEKVERGRKKEAAGRKEKKTSIRSLCLSHLPAFAGELLLLQLQFQCLMEETQIL